MANPMYGQNKFDDNLNNECFKLKHRQFDVDFGIQAANTQTLATFSKGDIILAFSAVITEAVTSGGSATIQFGFTGTTMLSAAVGKATAVIDYPIGPANAADAAPLLLVADDTFDSTVGTAACTAGKANITVWYLEAPAFTSENSIVLPAS